LRPHPWYGPSPPREPETFGYFGPQDFVPSGWRGTLANPAFREMSLRDALWAARIISRFTDADLAAIVARAEMTAPAAEYLTATLIHRRDSILREYLTRASPLDRFALAAPRAQRGSQSLCFEDRALAAKVAEPGDTMYRLQLRGGAHLERLMGWRQLRPDPAHPTRSCVELPFSPERPADLSGAAAPDDHPLRYAELLIDSRQRPSLAATARVVIHLYDLGPTRGFRVVGLERSPVPTELP
jgi:hypothetical protein